MNGIAQNHLEDKRRSGGAGGGERLETLLRGACDRVAHRPRSLVIISTHQKAARRPGGASEAVSPSLLQGPCLLTTAEGQPTDLAFMVGTKQAAANGRPKSALLLEDMRRSLAPACLSLLSCSVLICR